VHTEQPIRFADAGHITAEIYVHSYYSCVILRREDSASEASE